MTALQILQAFKSTNCVCGRKKKEQQSHCSKCYFTLPHEMRMALYKRFGQGYEEAYEASIAFLQPEQQNA